MRARFQLFVAGDTASSVMFADALRRLCDEVYGAEHDIEVVDVLADPVSADAARVLAVPTVVKLSPGPQRRAIGDLSDTGKLAAALELFPPSTGGTRP